MAYEGFSFTLLSASDSAAPQFSRARCDADLLAYRMALGCASRADVYSDTAREKCFSARSERCEQRSERSCCVPPVRTVVGCVRERLELRGARLVIARLCAVCRVSIAA